MVLVELPLDIPDIAVKQTISTCDQFTIEVESTVTGTTCHKCGQPISKPFGKGREVSLRHSSAFGKAVVIKIAPPRYQCTNCAGNPTTTQTASWYTQGCSLTLSFENQILKSLINGTVEDVALKEGVGYETVMGVLKRRIKTETDWEIIDKIDFIGLDEISLKKGHKDFVTVVSALTGDDLTILAILEGREKKTVKNF